MPRAKKDTQIVTTTTQPALPVELLKIAESSGMQITEAQAIGLSFAPFMQRVNELSIAIQDIPVDDPTPEHAATARKLRLELVANRGKNGVLNAHKELKSSLLIKANLIDNYKNIIEDSSKMSEVVAEGIEKHSERKEAVRLDAVEQERLTALLPYGTNTEFVNIRLMDDSTFTRFLANEKLLFEAQELERVKAEEARLQAEKEAEDERKRLSALKQSRTKLLTDAGFRFDGVVFWVINVPSVSVEDLVMLADEGFESVLKSGSDRIKQEAEEQRKRDAELKRMQDAEKARLEKEAADKKVRDALKAKRLKELEPFHSSASMMDLGGMSEPLFKDLLNTAKSEHTQRIQAQKERERNELEARVECDRLAAIQAQKDKELQELKDKQASSLKQEQEKEAARIKAEQDAAKAPDKVKLKAWFEELKALQERSPSFTSDAGKTVGVAITEAFNTMRREIATAAQGLK